MQRRNLMDNRALSVGQEVSSVAFGENERRLGF